MPLGDIAALSGRRSDGHIGPPLLERPAFAGLSASDRWRAPLHGARLRGARRADTPTADSARGGHAQQRESEGDGGTGGSVTPGEARIVMDPDDGRSGLRVVD